MLAAHAVRSLNFQDHLLRDGESLPNGRRALKPQTETEDSMKPMIRGWRLCGVTFFAVAVCACSSGERAAFAQWGHVEGQFVFDGDVPQLPLLVKQGDSAVKDAAVCSAGPVPDDSA